MQIFFSLSLPKFPLSDSDKHQTHLITIQNAFVELKLLFIAPSVSLSVSSSLYIAIENYATYREQTLWACQANNFYLGRETFDEGIKIQFLFHAFQINMRISMQTG